MEEEQQVSGPLRVGMRWGGIGGLAGFLASLVLASLGGLVASVFVGIACGRRAAAAGDEKQQGGKAGLVGGLMAAPVFVLGAASGALVSVREVGLEELSSTLGDFSGMQVSSQEAWVLILAGLAFAAVVQAGALVLSSVLAASRTAKKEEDKGE
ncbi:hypothetical protein [Rubrobacter aplysinae]|uniref:hypothetical protein n=1 Tax=Rubrobacter aplysinae TaxID=909625 RepID=UPI00064C0F01|nr:hypothetical protein [Rubrobacter aplysinae]